VREDDAMAVSEPLTVTVSTKCCGYGICAEICPEVFKLDENGFAYVEGPVPPEHMAAALEAYAECPEEAIEHS
jgi:ferredoxin